MSWADWAAGVLDQIGAPYEPINNDTLWAWSNAESGSDVMRWNNPLNTTLDCCGGVNQNPVGVKAYPTVQDGITATASTLLNGRYPIIVSHLQTSIPRQSWDDACGELGTWGTGCGWLHTDYGAAPGLITPTGVDAMLIQIGNGNAYVVGDNGKRLIAAAELFVWNRAGVKQTAVSQAEADSIPNVSSGGAEPPEPTEPKIVTGTFTGTLT